MKCSRSLLPAFALLASVLATRVHSTDVAELLKRPILTPDTALAEVQAFTESRVPVMPGVASLGEWEKFAQHTRENVFDRVIFRDKTSQGWRDAKCNVEWLDTIPGGPGYHIKKLRYEALPGMWIPALLYEPENVAGKKIPVHLAVNGHDMKGKAAPYKQLRCINLAKRGIASLNVEWFNMGQLRSDGFAHNRMNQLDLCGVSGIAPFYLAMSRGIDVLLALPYADSKRVAVSGLSGGGWQTITISSLDPRVTLCNPVAGYSSFRTRARFLSDLGDSEQTPNDLATAADYAQLTAMLAGRAALLTFNAKDNCCFASDHAMQPLVDAAAPIFKLYGQPERLRTHVNYEPGTHNYELDNRQAFYRFVGDNFFPGDANYIAQEIPSESEVKTSAELDVPLPQKNLDFHQLALQESQGLPRTTAAAHEDLAKTLRYTQYRVASAEKLGSEARGDLRATFWKLRLGEAWTVPITELSRGEPQSTTIFVADGGRSSAEKDIEAALAAGQRVLAVDPFYFGESKIPKRDYLFAFLVAAVGERPLGIQASQVSAVARWAQGQFHTTARVSATGPRSSLYSLVAAALEERAILEVELHDSLRSLRDVLNQDITADARPEAFCFGLLEKFDIPQLVQLAGAGRVK